jgi:hypothetical protein
MEKDLWSTLRSPIRVEIDKLVQNRSHVMPDLIRRPGTLKCAAIPWEEAPVAPCPLVPAAPSPL